MVRRLSNHAEKQAVSKGHYFFPLLTGTDIYANDKDISVNGVSVMGQGGLAAPAQSGINIPERAAREQPCKHSKLLVRVEQ